MKKALLYSACIFFVIACNQESMKTGDDASKKNDDMNAVYEKNLADLKAGFAAFAKGDFDTWASTIADTVFWTSPAYGDILHTKAHWKEFLKGFTDNWTNISLNDPIYLPGVDSATHVPDGSVRYYGTWNAVHKSGIKTSLVAYGTYNFNKDNKVISGSDYFDVGGLINAVTPKAGK